MNNLRSFERSELERKFNCAPADCRHYISASCLLCFLYRKPLKIFIFTLSLKHHSEDFFTIIFTSSIKFAWESFQFFLGVSGHHKRNWRQFTDAKFWGVNGMFYGRCKNGEYVNNFIIIFVLLLWKCVINVWQDFFRSESFHELLCAIVFFSNGFEINLLYSQLSLNKHLFRRTTLWCWPLSLSSHLTVTMLSIRRKPLKDGQPTLLKPSTDNWEVL